MKLIGVCITTDDAPRLATFYEVVFQESPEVDGQHYAFASAQLSVYDPGDVQVSEHKNMSLMYYVDDVPAEYARLTLALPDMVVDSPPQRRPWGALSFWCLDPDGNLISFVQREGEP